MPQELERRHVRFDHNDLVQKIRLIGHVDRPGFLKRAFAHNGKAGNSREHLFRPFDVRPAVAEVRPQADEHHGHGQSLSR